jgi:hypothetical protein
MFDVLLYLCNVVCVSSLPLIQTLDNFEDLQEEDFEQFIQQGK